MAQVALSLALLSILTIWAGGPHNVVSCEELKITRFSRALEFNSNTLNFPLSQNRPEWSTLSKKQKAGAAVFGERARKVKSR
jgi:hypothetical protein